VGEAERGKICRVRVVMEPAQHHTPVLVPALKDSPRVAGGNARNQKKPGKESGVCLFLLGTSLDHVIFLFFWGGARVQVPGGGKMGKNGSRVKNEQPKRGKKENPWGKARFEGTKPQEGKRGFCRFPPPPQRFQE